MKKIGILAPIFTLPNKFGIGDFSIDTYKFIDYLYDLKLNYWQLLPLTPTGFGNSPYQSISSFAIDDIYVSLVDLKNRGLIKSYKPYKENIDKINYDEVRKYKLNYFLESFNNFIKDENNLILLNKFLSNNKWADEYAEFVILNRINEFKSWNEWEVTHIDKDKNKEFLYEVFKQYILKEEWLLIHKYANDHNIKIIGDIPFYVGYNSSDCYFNKECFLLDEKYNPKLVAGVPPDYFSTDGQLWGNPIYNFEYLKSKNYKLLIDRIIKSLDIYDVIRLDHFRAFDTYYVVDAKETTAKVGRWKLGPASNFFDILYRKNKNVKIIAEDLGDMRDEVYKLRDKYNLPGMEVFQFTFFDEEIYHHELPYIYKRKNAIFYSGTHDNDTLIGWYNNLNIEDKNKLDDYLESRFPGDNLVTKVFKYLLSEPANTIIFSIVDVLKLDSNARYNIPGLLSDVNWSFKLTTYKNLFETKTYMKNLLKEYNK